MDYPTLSNIPLWNLLEEFFMFRATLQSQGFKSQLREPGNRPIRLPIYVWNGPPGTRTGNPLLFDWHGHSNDLLTLILQRSIMGLECFVVSAAWLDAPRYGILDPEKRKKLLNPYNLRGEGTAENYYHLLPSMLSESFSLKQSKPELRERTKDFYKVIRNPLFHGMQLATDNPDDVTPLLALIESIYDWINIWHDGDIAAAKRSFSVAS